MRALPLCAITQLHPNQLWVFPPSSRLLRPAGDLGAIDARYDVAVSTACPSLDYIVVETTSAAQRCVELLRQRQLGVATFLILEKQQHLGAAMQAKAAPPEGGWGLAGLSSLVTWHSAFAHSWRLLWSQPLTLQERRELCCFAKA